MRTSGQQCSPVAQARCLGLNHCEQRARQLIGDAERPGDSGNILRQNTADWLTAVKKLREEVLKTYKRYNTLAWNIKFSSYFLDVAEMSARDLDEAQGARAHSSSAPPPEPLHCTEATAGRNREGTVATLLRRELPAQNAHDDGIDLTSNAFRNKVCTNPWRFCNWRVPVDCSKNLCATCCRAPGMALLVVPNALSVGHAIAECLSDPIVCHSVGSARRPGHVPHSSHSRTSTCWRRWQNFGLLTRSICATGGDIIWLQRIVTLWSSWF